MTLRRHCLSPAQYLIHRYLLRVTGKQPKGASQATLAKRDR